MGFEGFNIGLEENEGSESRRSNGIAFGDGFSGVSDSIESIGVVADTFGETGHFGDSTGVVSNGTVGISGNDDSGSGKHGDSRECDAVDTILYD